MQLACLLGAVSPTSPNGAPSLSWPVSLVGRGAGGEILLADKRRGCVTSDLEATAATLSSSGGAVP